MIDLSTKDFSFFMKELVFFIYIVDRGLVIGTVDFDGWFTFLLTIGILKVSLYSAYSIISFFSFYFYLIGKRIGGSLAFSLAGTTYLIN